MDDVLTIPVRLMRDDGQHWHLQALDSLADCPQCARGEGCGARPWFRGFFKSRTLVIPRPPDLQLTPGDYARLSLPASTLNLLTLWTYGLPLFAFIAALALARSQPEALQLALAISSAAASSIASRNIGTRYLQRRLRLHPSHTESAAVTRCTP